MPDIAWQELLVIAVVAIIVVGPRELPQLMRTVGRWLSRARRYAREFQYDMEQLGRDAELEELRKHLDSFNKPVRLDEKRTAAASVKPPPEEPEDLPDTDLTPEAPPRREQL